MVAVGLVGWDREALARLGKSARRGTCWLGRDCRDDLGCERHGLSSGVGMVQIWLGVSEWLGLS